MKSDERRTREMGVRVVLDSERHPDTDPAHGVLVGRLKGVVQQMEQEEALQRSALMDRHTSALDKRRLRREMLAGPIAHVGRRCRRPGAEGRAEPGDGGLVYGEEAAVEPRVRRLGAFMRRVRRGSD